MRTRFFIFPLTISLTLASWGANRDRVLAVEWEDLQSPGTPGNREGAGSHNSCPGLGDLPSDLDDLIAIVPPEHPDGEEYVQRYGGSNPLLYTPKTRSDRPTFWFYIPYTADRVRNATFAIESEEDIIYEREFLVPEEPAIVGISTLDLGTNVPNLLQPGQYYWYLRINCDRTGSNSDHIFVQGSFERVEVTEDPLEAIAAASPSDRLDWYAQNHLWYETTTMLVELMKSNPNDAIWQAEWTEWLESVGLEQLADVPIITD